MAPGLKRYRDFRQMGPWTQCQDLSTITIHVVKVVPQSFQEPFPIYPIFKLGIQIDKAQVLKFGRVKPL